MSVIELKSRREIAKMRDAGRLVAEAHAIAANLCRPGIRTIEIDREIEQLFARHQATPLFKNYPGPTPFPAVTCISVNEQVVHGIPGDYVLKEGDIVSVDTGCRLNGWCGDSAWTYAVGNISAEKQHLMMLGRQVLEIAIQGFGEETHWSKVSARMEKAVKAAGCSLVDQFVGHGIGREMHEAPQVPNHVNRDPNESDFALRPGLVLAIEPMVNAGVSGVKTLPDGWTVITNDGKPSVHFEHTVALTPNGPEILTTLD
ncbi:MAG: type I methionyl aminopeptidase [Planctomycetaceae bacterium]